MCIFKVLDFSDFEPPNIIVYIIHNILIDCQLYKILDRNRWLLLVSHFPQDDLVDSNNNYYYKTRYVETMGLSGYMTRYIISYRYTTCMRVDRHYDYQRIYPIGFFILFYYTPICQIRKIFNLLKTITS